MAEKKDKTENAPKPYVLLRDRRPKAERVKRSLPSGAVVSFKSAFEYEEGALWDAMGTLQQSERDIRLIPVALRKMSHDADENVKIMAAEPNWIDLDTFDILRDVSEEVFEAMGSLGESQG